MENGKKFKVCTLKGNTGLIDWPEFHTQKNLQGLQYQTQWSKYRFFWRIRYFQGWRVEVIWYPFYHRIYDMSNSGLLFRCRILLTIHFVFVIGTDFLLHLKQVSILRLDLKLHYVGIPRGLGYFRKIKIVSAFDQILSSPNGQKWTLSQCRNSKPLCLKIWFKIKEHCVVVAMAKAASGRQEPCSMPSLAAYVVCAKSFPHE